MDYEKLYLTVEEAARYVGIGRDLMRELLNSDDPPPYMQVGNRKLVQKAALEGYFERRQEVRWR